ncbi:MAG: DNA-binding protein [Chloroflexi bacterium]|nr:MAG: DNA-binding protein [Chloroflexota bacterium]
MINLYALIASITMKNYLGVSEIARIIGKERSTIIRWVKTGIFGNVPKMGNEYQIPHEKFISWWAEHLRAGG